MTACPVRTTEELEIDAFERLKPRLAELWDTVFPGDDESYTSVIVPSLTLDQAEMAKIPAIHWYEERLLFLLMRLRNPQARVVYVTSQPVHPMVLDYNAWQLERQQQEGTLLCCDVQFMCYETCRAWGDFSNKELSQFCVEMLGERVRVTWKVSPAVL